jgi:hypothetical protein
LESRTIFEGSRPTNAIRLQSYFANLPNPVDSGRYASFRFYFHLDNRAARKRIMVLLVQFGEIERD